MSIAPIGSTYPVPLPPVTNITPFTYRDGTTFLELIEGFRKWTNDVLVPEFNSHIDQAIAAVTLAQDHFTTDTAATKADWTTRFNAYMADVNASLMALNDHAMSVLINNPASETGVALSGLFASKAWGNSIDALITGAGRLAAATLDARFNDETTARTAADTALGVRVDGVVTTATGARAAADAHHARHEWQGPDAVAIDRRQVVSPVRDWFRDLLQTRAVAPVRYVMMGDSQTNDGSLITTDDNTSIWGGGSGYSYRFAALMTGEAPARCEQGTAGVTSNTQPGVHVWTSAIAGRRADNYAEPGTITNIGTIAPHLVTHMIGTNDFTLQLSPDGYKTNVLAALNGVWGVAPNARQLVIVPWPPKPPAGMAHPWTEYTAKLYEIRDQLKGDTRFELYDFGATIQRSGTMGFLFPDGIHGDRRLHRELAEHLAEWAGLPSPIAMFGGGHIINGSKFRNGAMDNFLNPTSAATVYGAPVPRVIRLTAKVLCTISGEGDISVQAIDDNLNKETFPFHVQAQSLSDKVVTFDYYLPPNSSRYFYLSGSAVVSVTSGPGYDQYNAFTADCRYA